MRGLAFRLGAGGGGGRECWLVQLQARTGAEVRVRSVVLVEDTPRKAESGAREGRGFTQSGAATL